VSIQTDAFPFRVLSRRGGIGPERVVIQVARSEEAMLQELRDLELILVFGLPVAVALRGLGGYTFARGVLAPIEQMTERAQTITAERLSDRLPVSNPRTKWDASRPSSTNARAAPGIFRPDAALHRRRLP